ncbi:MAG TPA: secretion system protein E, partial [Verrucomicrobia bacterium]|nr:secretion system protein E [Verrucomicrobiota bacterium]
MPHETIEEQSMLRQVIRDLKPETEQQIDAASRRERLTLLSNASGIDAMELLILIGHASGVQVLHRFEPDVDTTKGLPERFIHSGFLLPIVPPPDTAGKRGTLCLATLWPPDARLKRWAYAVCGGDPEWFLVDPERLMRTISVRFGVGAGSLDASDEIGRPGDENDQEDESAAIIRFVDEIVKQAMRDRATDIHFEPRKDSLQIRYRIDGKLVPVHVPPNLVSFQSAIISRIKIMSRMNISEKRRPQDGRITYGRGHQEVDVRVSTLPTMYGESVSMRLLNEQSQPVSIQELGFLPDDEQRINKVLEMPHGILLITGPTGSGKSTTLAAFMRQIGTPERRIITVEDPIEYEIPQINQTQVNHEIGLSFANAL